MHSNNGRASRLLARKSPWWAATAAAGGLAMVIAYPAVATANQATNNSAGAYRQAEERAGSSAACHRHGHRHKCHRGCRRHCPRGPRGPRGPASLGIDTAFQGNSKYIGLVRTNRHTLIRDPNTSPRWHDLSSLSGYPARGATDVSLATNGDNVHVTVRGPGNSAYQTICKVNPTPGTGGNPAWPGNCSAFTNLTPPA